MRRFFIKGRYEPGDVCRVCGGEAHHIAHVLRMRPGDEVLLCGDGGAEYTARLESVEQEVAARIVSVCRDETEQPCRITLYQGIPKGDKLEEVCKRCTEIGVDAFVPVKCTRSVSKWQEKDTEHKLERLRRTVLSACKQCGGSVPASVSGPVSVREAAEAEHGLKLAAYEKESALSIMSAVHGSEADDIAIFIGPEGGISEQEMELLVQNGWISVSLGKRILRTENAGFAAAALVLAALGRI